MYLRSSYHSIDISQDFFNVPVHAPTRGQTFYGDFEKTPISVAFYDAQRDIEAVYWFICAHRRVAVTRHEMICRVLLPQINTCMVFFLRLSFDTN